jgi:hypothetical protein
MANKTKKNTKDGEPKVNG